MKIAAIADIHGNYQALISVIDHLERWNPDLVLVLGDIVNRGPRSKECLHLIQDRKKNQGWQVIKGNHEGYVLNFLDSSFSRTGFDFELRKVIFWTYQSLHEDELQYLNNLPEKISLDLDNGQTIRGVHASIIGDRVGIYPDSTDEELTKKVDAEADLFLVGHTHQPLIRSFQDTIICNVGSVGLPFDGNKKAAYAQFTHNKGHWSGDIVRVDYDLSIAAKDYLDSGFIPEGGPLADLVLAEHKLGWPQLSLWFKRYEKGVLAEEISLDQAVEELLQNPSIEKIRHDIPMSYP